MLNVEVYKEKINIYNFSINNDGNIDFKIDGFLVDVIKEFGFIENLNHLRTIVFGLLKAWDVNFKFIS